MSCFRLVPVPSSASPSRDFADAAPQCWRAFMFLSNVIWVICKMYQDVSRCHILCAKSWITFVQRQVPLHGQCHSQKFNVIGQISWKCHWSWIDASLPLLFSMEIAKKGCVVGVGRRMLHEGLCTSSHCLLHASSHYFQFVRLLRSSSISFESLWFAMIVEVYKTDPMGVSPQMIQ